MWENIVKNRVCVNKAAEEIGQEDPSVSPTEMKEYKKDILIALLDGRGALDE